MPGVVSSRSSHTSLHGLVLCGTRHARRGLVVVLSHAFAWAHCSRGIRHARHGLVAVFSHAFAWARCSRSIRHTRRGLVEVFSHAFTWARCSSRYPSCPAWSPHCPLTCLCVGSLFLRYLSRPAWSRCGLLTRLCVGLLFLWGLVVAAPVTGREVGLWREIIDCVEKNLQTSYRAPSFIPFPPLWTSQSHPQDQYRISPS